MARSCIPRWSWCAASCVRISARLAKQQGEEILLKLFEQQKRMGMQQYRSVIQDSCHQIRANMMYEQRLQLLNFLVMIAQADGVVNSPGDSGAQGDGHPHGAFCQGCRPDAEPGERGFISQARLDDAYRILGISPDASNDEVKASLSQDGAQASS